MNLDLTKLTPRELEALIVSLDPLKPVLSEQAWELAHALNDEEHRRVLADEEVVYSLHLNAQQQGT